MMNNGYIVYKHTSPNNKVYIGITSQSPERRWRKNGFGYKNHIYFWNAIKKYGWGNFKHEILFSGLTKKEAEQKEIELISYYQSNKAEYGYNLSTGGESGSKGYKYTEDQKARQSNSHAGVKNGMYGKHHTDEANQRNRVAHLRENLSRETINKMSIAKKGKKRSKQSIEKQIKKISKMVVCVENNAIYPSIKMASLLTGIDKSCISKVCRGERKTAGGFHWMYVDSLNSNTINISTFNEVGVA